MTGTKATSFISSDFIPFVRTPSLLKGKGAQLGGGEAQKDEKSSSSGSSILATPTPYSTFHQHQEKLLNRRPVGISPLPL